MPDPVPEVASRILPDRPVPIADQEGWVRVEIRAERLDWVPGVLAALDAELVIEGPDELRDRVRALGRRLVDAAGRTP